MIIVILGVNKQWVFVNLSRTGIGWKGYHQAASPGTVLGVIELFRFVDYVVSNIIRKVLFNSGYAVIAIDDNIIVKFNPGVIRCVISANAASIRTDYSVVKGLSVSIHQVKQCVLSADKHATGNIKTGPINFDGISAVISEYLCSISNYPDAFTCP